MRPCGFGIPTLKPFLMFREEKLFPWRNPEHACYVWGGKKLPLSCCEHLNRAPQTFSPGNMKN